MTPMRWGFCCCAWAGKLSAKSKVLSAKPRLFFLMSFLLAFLLSFAPFSLLFNHLHRAVEHFGRDGDADLACGLEIDGQIELGRLHQRQFAGFGAFEDLVDIFRRAPG